MYKAVEFLSPLILEEVAEFGVGDCNDMMAENVVEMVAAYSFDEVK